MNSLALQMNMPVCAEMANFASGNQKQRKNETNSKPSAVDADHDIERHGCRGHHPVGH